MENGADQCKAHILFDSDTSQEEDEVWDEKRFNDDLALAQQVAEAEAALNMATFTNTKQKPKQGPVGKGKLSAKTSVKWNVGMPCRAVYEEDGFSYEAFVVKLVNEKECIVRFLGYDNCEVVAIDSLKPSDGSEACYQQLIEALYPQCLDNKYVKKKAPSGEAVDDANDGAQQNTEKSSKKHNKKNAQKKKNVPKEQIILADFPDLSFVCKMPKPVVNMLKNIQDIMHSDVPKPPPPPPMKSGSDMENRDEMYSMLNSWYTSGYYTGLYEGMKRAKEIAQNGN
ncbi:hypothetical protein ACJJTC_017943 [Scirpophaga incertulas]